MKLSFVSYLIFLILCAISYTKGEDEEMCDFRGGDYKTVRLSDGKICLIKTDNYYIFSDKDIKNAEIHPITDIYPHTSTPIDESFRTNGKVYYLRGNDAIVYKEHIEKEETPTLFDWRQLESHIDHLIIRRNGETIGFFVPPKTFSAGFSRSVSQSNDLQIISFGSGSLSSSSINGQYRIQYNGWNIPIEFNAFLVNLDNSLTFFHNDKYCVVKKNSKRSDFEWKEVSDLFGC